QHGRREHPRTGSSRRLPNVEFSLIASLVVVAADRICGQWLRPELDRRSKVRNISLKEGPRRVLCRRAVSQQHEDADLSGRRRDAPTRYFGPGTEVSRQEQSRAAPWPGGNQRWFG